MGIVHKYLKYRECHLVSEECRPETPQKSKSCLGCKSCTWAVSGWHIAVVIAALLASHSAMCLSSHSLGNGSWTIPHSETQNATSDTLIQIVHSHGLWALTSCWKKSCLERQIETSCAFSLPEECLGTGR